METILQNKTYPFLQGGGEMGEIIRKFDWSKTSVDTPDQWPQSLQISLANVLNSGFPMFLFWGEDLICFYNDAFRPSLGVDGKHPAIGKKGKEVWSEIWDFIGPLINSVLTTAKPVWFEDQLVPFYRNGRMEDIYWTFSYSLIVNDDGSAGGVLVTCMETTASVISRQQMQTSEDKFRSLIEQAPFATALYTGPELTIDVVNEAMLQLWGKPASVIGKTLGEALPELQGQPFEMLLRNVYATGIEYSSKEQAADLEIEGKMRRGWYNFTYRPLHNDKGQVYAVINMAVDVTERVLAQKKIEESQKELLSLFEEAPVAIATISADERLVFESSNPFYAALVGRRPEDLVGKPLLEALPELKGQGFNDLLLSVLATGKSYTSSEVPAELVRNGKTETIYVALTYQPRKDTAGNVSGLLVIATDITGQVMARRKIEESEQLLTSMALEAPMGICLIDAGTLVAETVNDLFVEIAGKTKEDILGKMYWEVFAEAGPFYQKALQTVIETGNSFYASEVPVRLVRHGRGENRYVSFVYQPVKSDGRVQKIAIYVLENTPQVVARQKVEGLINQRTAELEQANEILQLTNKELQRSNSNLEEFAHAASHDLKEPIRKIHFFTQQLKEQLSGHLKDNELRSFGRIENATKRMGMLIDDLLLYSHVSQRPHEKELVDLNEKINKVLEDLELDIEEKRAMIHVGRLPLVQGYRRQLQQLFQNLLSNALKYSKVGVPPRVEVTASQTEVAGRVYHLIAVSDNGIGFDEQYADKIFQMFSRLHGRNEYSGTGVGLSIAKKVVENHHGYIRVRSIPEEGSIFEVLLPA